MTSELFSSVEISQHLLPICLSLMEDKVAEVRLVAYRLVSLISGSTMCNCAVSLHLNLFLDVPSFFPSLK